MVNVGLIGCGYWGPNLLRNFLELSNCQIKAIAELDDSRIDYLNQKFPSLPTTKDYRDLMNGSIDAVVIATQPRTHYSLAKEALQNKKHVLVEKPLAMSVAQARELIELANKHQRKLMVGHTFEYSEPVRLLKKYMHSEEIGRLYYLYSQRVNFGIVRQDVNALWNLAPHDISIILYLLEKMPVMVSAKGVDFLQKGIEDIVFMVLHFPDDVIAHVHVSWLDPNKVRRMTLVGSEKMIVYDDVSDAKIKIYDKGIKKQNITESLGRYDDFGQYQSIKFAGDVILPKIDLVEPLKNECAHFIECIQQDKDLLTGGDNGLRVVHVLEAASRSMRQDGKNVAIEPLETFVTAE